MTSIVRVQILACLTVAFVASESSLGAVFPPRSTTNSTGRQTGLYLYLRPDTAVPLSPQRIAEVRASEELTRRFYAEASGGKLDLRYTEIVDVPITLVTGSDGNLHRPNDWFGIAENYVRNQYGIEPESYRVNLFDVSATPGDVGQGWAGIATFPGNNLAMQTNITEGFGQIVVDHELGHRFGAPHSSAWRVTRDDRFTPCGWSSKSGAFEAYSPAKHGAVATPFGVELDDYGDPFSVMGNIHREQFSVHQKLTNMNWLTGAQVPDLDEAGEGTFRIYAHDQLQATYSAAQEVWGVVDGYDTNSVYGLTFDKNAELWNKNTRRFESRQQTVTVEFRQDEGVLFYLNDGVLDLDPTGANDRNHRERGLGVGERIEDIAFGTSYFIGTGTAGEFLASNPTAPSPYWEVRPEWYEFRVLSEGLDAIGSFVDIAVDLVQYVPLGDLNDDGLFNDLDVNLLVANWLTDTNGLNSIAQQQRGDLNNSGFVDQSDAFLLRRILFENARFADAAAVLTLVPEPGAVVPGSLALVIGLCVALTRKRGGR
ncbi:dockerin type I repeat-containing protein [Aeoliella sp. SH292]|uniref:dockerin type I repeat-containing protein n=1 Tax=Aeoliella sp. SH292 TaxID=3454464 RepID=UPI003F991EAC